MIRKQPDQNNNCSVDNGTMPSCAPLAVPYVPFQQQGSRQYGQNEALNAGTLFPALDLPFHLKETASNVVSGPLSQLQALDFVVHELALYLDTHPEDAEAFALFRRYAAMAKEAQAAYVEKNGPMTLMDVMDSESYNWPDQPWPWQRGVGGNA